MTSQHRSRILGVGLKLCILLVLFALVGCSAQSGTISERRGKIYQSPEAALEEFKTAFRSEDPEQLVVIFGEEGRDIVITGDPVADRAAMRRIARKLDERAEVHPVEGHKFVNEQWYKVRFGMAGWDMRIPLTNSGEGWYFATYHAKEAAQETRIAINELTAMHTLAELVVNQRQYFAKDRDGDGVQEYAQRLIGTPGKRDGLYWEVAPGEEPSPLQRLVNEARSDGYKIEPGNSYEGYYYRVLTAQGASAKGGRRNFLTGSDLTGGFAIIAYPRVWQTSGLNTYIIDSSGRMYKKDLGFRTTSIAGDMKSHNPDATWFLVDRSNYGEDINLGPLQRSQLR